jgi:hypothetical protein
MQERCQSISLSSFEMTSGDGRKMPERGFKTETRECNLAERRWRDLTGGLKSQTAGWKLSDHVIKESDRELKASTGG